MRGYFGQLKAKGHHRRPTPVMKIGEKKCLFKGPQSSSSEIVLGGDQERTLFPVLVVS